MTFYMCWKKSGWCEMRNGRETYFVTKSTLAGPQSIAANLSSTGVVLFLIQMESTSEPHPWRDSNAQKVLQALLVSGEIPCTATNKERMLEIWTTHCLPRREFAGFQFAKFPKRLRAMQKRHATQYGHAEAEEAILLLHKNTFLPHWRISEGSPSGMDLTLNGFWRLMLRQK